MTLPPNAAYCNTCGGVNGCIAGCPERDDPEPPDNEFCTGCGCELEDDEGPMCDDCWVNHQGE